MRTLIIFLVWSVSLVGMILGITAFPEGNPPEWYRCVILILLLSGFAATGYSKIREDEK